MNKLAILAIAMLMPLTGGCTQPVGMYKDAQVRVDNSGICFSVSDDVETRRTPPQIAAITVSKQLKTEAVTVWKLSMVKLKPPVTLRPEDCIPFGYTGNGPARESEYNLISGERYSVDINADIPNLSPRGDKLLNRMYSRDFCLTKGPQDQLQIIIVPWGKGAPQWDVCGPAEAAK